VRTIRRPAAPSAIAARQAIASPLLEVNIAGAQGILFNITGSSNLSLYEVTEAAEEITRVFARDGKLLIAGNGGSAAGIIGGVHVA
jgi:cell division GTPase FtsZ